MKLFQFLIGKLTILLIVGILIGYYINFSWRDILMSIAVTFFLLIIAFSISKTKQYRFFAVLTYMLTIAIGALIINLHTHKNHSYHYSLKINKSNTQNLKIHIYKKLKSNTYYHKYLAKVVAINKNSSSGILLINVDSTSHFSIDDFLYINTDLKEINSPLNPYQFNYKDYMSKNKVYHQVFLNSINTVKLSSIRSFYGIAEDIRKRIYHTLVQYSVSQKHISIINALLLGQRQDVSENTYSSFTKSGTIHILAISGLHIGLLMFLLNIFFKPLTNFKNIKKVIPFLIVLILWFYAFITGMSASVIRAVTMFSLITIAFYSNRITNTYHTLIISIFLLLLYNPFYLFDIGFQLSYAAVFAIVSIKPLFDKIWIPKYYVIRKLWDVFTVTLAVQFGVLPLSLFYFHQFPGLFFISNMIVIPLLGFLLSVGLLTLIFAFFGWIPKILLVSFEYCISSLLSFVDFFASKEAFVFSKIPFNSLNLICWYFFIICFIFLIKNYSYKQLILTFLSVISMQFGYLYNKSNTESSEFIVYNQYKNTLLLQKRGRELFYTSSNSKYPSVIDNYIVNKFINSVYRDSLKNVYVFKEHKILVIDSNGVFNSSFRPDIVVLTNSPKINLNRLLKVLRPRLIVVDNNNYKSYIERWKHTCFKKQVAFYNVKTDGAFVLK